jgi:broad specificity phosphatase PhoE
MTSTTDSPASSNGASKPPASDRFEAPMYLARFRDRTADPDETDSADDGLPLYLKRFRNRGANAPSAGSPTTPLWQRADLGTQQALTEDSRNKEISAPASSARKLLNDIYLIRHGETQGYSTDSGLTPQGAWQAHTYGRTLSRRIKDGETIVFRHAATNRARETAEQIHRGLVDGLVQYEKDITIVEPEPADEFRNFQFVAPDGLKDVTAAFRQYSALLEGHERTAEGDRPLWLVEMDRFWRTQQGGGDPIQHWLTIPLMHFEPPSMAVRRFWAGISRLSGEFPGARLAIATHSGCIRAFAVSALGYDPGEPFNTEHVRVKLLGDTDWSKGGRDALVAYRNRVQEMKVPAIDQLPNWSVRDDWAGMSESSAIG